MIHGTTAKILRVDLSTNSIEIEEFTEDFYELYPGGKALAGFILLNEMSPHTDPFAPENVLVIANGLLTGAPISTATRYVVSARSPLTMGYGESEAGGFWGPELKMAGFRGDYYQRDTLPKTSLFMDTMKVRLKSDPAGHLWGRLTAEVQEAIRAELSDDKIRVLQIGPAGENLVRYAGITNDLRHFNGRNGMGAVMGSKNLRAVAVRGRQRYQTLAYDPDALMKLGRKLAKGVRESPSRAGIYRNAAHLELSNHSTSVGSCRPEISGRVLSRVSMRSSGKPMRKNCSPPDEVVMPAQCAVSARLQ